VVEGGVWWERCRFFVFDVDCRVFVSSVSMQSLLSIFHANRILSLDSTSRLCPVKSWFVALSRCQSSVSNFNSAVSLPGFARAQHRFFPRLRARLLEFSAVDTQSLSPSSFRNATTSTPHSCLAGPLRVVQIAPSPAAPDPRERAPAPRNPIRCQFRVRGATLRSYRSSIADSACASRAVDVAEEESQICAMHGFVGLRGDVRWFRHARCCAIP
jgi:hypothetical protein